MSSTEITSIDLTSVLARYLPESGERLPVVALEKRLEQLYRHYADADEESFLRPAAAAALIDTVFENGGVESTHLSGIQKEAYSTAFPDESVQNLSELSEDNWQHTYRGPWKAALFDLYVRDQLNAGDHVGDLRLPPGTRAFINKEIPLDLWRIQLVDQDGRPATPLDEAVISPVLHVKRALLKFPDLRILSGAEASHRMRDVLEGDGVKEDDVEGMLRPFEELMEGPFESIAARVVPVLPFVVIAAGEGTRVLTGRRSFGDAITSAAERSIRPGIPAAVGGILLLLGAGIVSVPVALLTHLGMSRITSSATTSDRTLQRLERLHRIVATGDDHRAVKRSSQDK